MQNVSEHDPNAVSLIATAPHPSEPPTALRIWLMAAAIATGALTILFFLALDFSGGLGVREWVAILLIGTLTAGLLVSLQGIRDWQQWGVYGVTVLGFIAPFYANTFIPVPVVGFAIPFALLVVLFVIIRDRWPQFEH